MKQNTGLNSIMLSCDINANDPLYGILRYILRKDPFECFWRSICVQISVRILTWSRITINTWTKQNAHISNKLQKCRFCHFCLKPLLSNCCRVGFRSHCAAVHFSQGNTNTFFFFLHDVARGNAFKCVCKGASHPSESHSETWCVPNLCKMWKKKKQESVKNPSE